MGFQAPSKPLSLEKMKPLSLEKSCEFSRGVLFCQKLIDTFNFHNYDSLLHADSKKMDPRRRLGNKDTDLVCLSVFRHENHTPYTVSAGGYTVGPPIW